MSPPVNHGARFSAFMPHVLSVQVGLARRVKIGERNILTASAKQDVQGDVPVMPLGLTGDEQADLSMHGGLGKAFYAYPSEHYAYWQNARQQAGLGQIDDRLPHGSLGENLTFSGLLETDVWAGDVLRFLPVGADIGHAARG